MGLLVMLSVRRGVFSILTYWLLLNYQLVKARVQIPDELRNVAGMEEREDGLYFNGEKVVKVSGLGGEEVFNAKNEGPGDEGPGDEELEPEPEPEEEVDQDDEEPPPGEDFAEEMRRYEERESGEDGYINGEKIEKITPIESIEEVKYMQEILKMLPIKTIEEIKSIKEVKSYEEIDEAIAKDFIRKKGLKNILGKDGGYDRGMDTGNTGADDDCGVCDGIRNDLASKQRTLAKIESRIRQECKAKPMTGGGKIKKYGDDEDEDVYEGQKLSDLRGSASITPIKSIEEVEKITPIKSIEEVSKITPIKSVEEVKSITPVESIREVKHVYPLTDRQARELRSLVAETPAQKYSRRRHRRF